MSSAAGSRQVSVAVRTLGCKVNRVESESIAAELLGCGAVLVDEDDAVIIIINTCTVTAEADSKARKAVRHALRRTSEPVVVVTGCLAVLDGAGLRSLGDRVIVEADKDRVAVRVRELLGLREETGARSSARAGKGFRTRAILKIEDGCDNFCTYCIVPYARGVPRGVNLAQVLSEAEELVAAGKREIVLTGINIGRYRDAESGADLADLVGAIASTGIGRLRLSSIEPPDLTERLLGVLRCTPAACEHLHVPLQSGSDAVLSAMGRAYTTTQYAEWIAAARAAVPGLAVTTDVIAGFPGETEEQHADTMAFVRSVEFSKIHVFRYSARPGTPAASMPQVAPELRARRAAELRLVGAQLRESYVERRAGSAAEVLVESVGEGRVTGTTRDYLRVELPLRDGVPGSSVDWVVSARCVLPG